MAADIIVTILAYAVGTLIGEAVWRLIKRH
jgi:hypothetical protein